MKNMTLVIMAAGLGSRFKGGIKPFAQVGPNGETIMELTINDAKKIGFNKVIFITRRELKEMFESLIIPKIDLKHEFVFQEVSDIPIQIPIKREKPWGTGQALLCLKDVIKEDFVIVNADDYCGIEALQKLYNHFNRESKNYAMIAFRLKNTFTSSKIGNRGVCEIQNNKLKQIKEICHIEKINDRFIIGEQELNPNTYVSMNVWGFNSSIFLYFEEAFKDFLKDEENLNEKEFFIPTVINELLEKNIQVDAYPSEQICLGITYQEDILKFKKKM